MLYSLGYTTFVIRTEMPEKSVKAVAFQLPQTPAYWRRAQSSAFSPAQERLLDREVVVTDARGAFLSVLVAIVLTVLSVFLFSLF